MTSSDADTWVLVADSGRARLFTRQRDRSLVEQESLICPEERVPERDLVSDRVGRSFDSHGNARHAMEPRTTAQEQRSREFAAELAGRLEALRNSGALERLVLIAAPKFLGLLRTELTGPVRERVVLEIDKDIAQDSPERIAGQIPEFF